MSLTGKELSRYIQARREFANKFICPDCSFDLVLVPATQMNKAHDELDRARACTNGNCSFICFMGDTINRPVQLGAPIQEEICNQNSKL
jgi:hypothetical protein